MAGILQIRGTGSQPVCPAVRVRRGGRRAEPTATISSKLHFAWFRVDSRKREELMDVNTLSLATMVAATIYAGVMILSVRFL
jgi:hypothetical protein